MPHRVEPRTSRPQTDLPLTRLSLALDSRWCDYVAFGLDNAGLLSSLSSLMQNGTDAHQKPTTEPQGLDGLDTRGPGAWQEKDDCTTHGKCSAGAAPEGQSGEALQGA